MSAQALLSLIAPLAPPAPRGAATVDASAFEGLLMGALGGDGSVPGSESVQPESDALPAPGLLIAPVTPTATHAIVLASGPAPETLPVEAGPDADAVLPHPAATDTPPPEHALSRSTADAPPAEADLATSPRLADGEPSSLPVAPAPAVVTAPSPVPALAEAAPVAQSDSQAPVSAPAPVLAPTGQTPVDAGAAAAAAPAASDAPAPTAAPPMPAPAKPLPERTSEAKPAEKAEGDHAAPASSGVFKGAAEAAGPAVSPATDANPSAKPPIEAASAITADPEASPEDATLSPAPETTPQPPAHAPREAAPSTLSRVTLDATAQIAAQILRKLDGRSSRFEMSLTPDELGRVDVKLDIDSDGRLAARLAFDNPAAATDLRGRADELRRQLEAQGFQLADDAFEFTQRDSGSHAFDRGHDPRGGHARAFASAARLNVETDIAPARWTAHSLSPSGVDMKV